MGGRKKKLTEIWGRMYYGGKGKNQISDLGKDVY
jgi:hypothetical protein